MHSMFCEEKCRRCGEIVLYYYSCRQMDKLFHLFFF